MMVNLSTIKAEKFPEKKIKNLDYDASHFDA
jgi:hypothetical protein